jgi:hypothetical protein
MNSIQRCEIERRRWRALVRTLQVASLLGALTLFTALPVHGYSWYSGASVGSNGIVYGWGVTDVTSHTMHHQAYVTTTLTSPKGRKDGPVYGNAQNSVRVDVALGFDPSDLGTYLVESTNQGYCYACNCWIVNSGSGASVTIGHSDRWYKFDHYDEITDFCVWYPITPCSTACQANLIVDMPPCPTKGGKQNYLESYYYWWGSSKTCLMDVPQQRADNPGTCSN